MEHKAYVPDEVRERRPASDEGNICQIARAEDVSLDHCYRVRAFYDQVTKRIRLFHACSADQVTGDFEACSSVLSPSVFPEILAVEDLSGMGKQIFVGKPRGWNTDSIESVISPHFMFHLESKAEELTAVR